MHYYYYCCCTSVAFYRGRLRAVPPTTIDCERPSCTAVTDRKYLVPVLPLHCFASACGLLLCSCAHACVSWRIHCVDEGRRASFSKNNTATTRKRVFYFFCCFKVLCYVIHRFRLLCCLLCLLCTCPPHRTIAVAPAPSCPNGLKEAFQGAMVLTEKKRPSAKDSLLSGVPCCAAKAGVRYVHFVPP